MARTKQKKTRTRRSFSEEFKQEAVQMLLDGTALTIGMCGAASIELSNRASGASFLTGASATTPGCVSWQELWPRNKLRTSGFFSERFLPSRDTCLRSQ